MAPASALITAWSRPGMLRIRLSNLSFGIAYQTVFKAISKAAMSPIRPQVSPSSFSMSNQRFSIVFKSGDWVGHWIDSIPLRALYCLEYHWCPGAPSSTTAVHPYISQNRCQNGTRWGYMIVETYRTESTLAFQGIKTSRDLRVPQKPPHIIWDSHPNSNVSSMQSEWYSSKAFLFTQGRFPKPAVENVDSSVHSTRSQSSYPQPRQSRHQATWIGQFAVQIANFRQGTPGWYPSDSITVFTVQGQQAYPISRHISSRLRRLVLASCVMKASNCCFSASLKIGRRPVQTAFDGVSFVLILWYIFRFLVSFQLHTL